MIRKTFKYLFCLTKRPKIEKFFQSSSDEDILEPELLNAIEQQQKLNCNEFKNLSLSEEELIALISSYVSPLSLLSIYETHRNSVSLNHSLLLIRIMSRHPDLLQQQINNINFSNRIESFVNDINKNILNMNKLDLIDILFWIRKLTSAGVFALGPKFLNSNAIHQRVLDFVEKGEYSLRYIINIYFDYTYLNRPTEKVLEVALRLMKDPKSKQEINFISSLTMSKACLQKASQKRCIDVNLMNIFNQFSEEILDDSDPIQQSAYLLDLTRLRVQIYDSYYQFPKIVFRIIENIKNIIFRLQEASIIQLFQAYLYLPPYFSPDLIQSLQKIIVKTLDQKPNQIRQEFSFRILNQLFNMSQNFVDQECLIKIANHIVEGLQEKNNTFLRNNRIFSLVKILCTMNVQIYEKNKQIIQTLSENHICAIPFLFIRHNLQKEDISNELNQLLIQIKNQNQQRNLIELYLLGSLLEDYNIDLEFLYPKIFMAMQQKALLLPKYSFDLTKPNSPYLTKILLYNSRTIQSLISARSLRIENLKFFPKLLYNDDLLNYWIDWCLKQDSRYLFNQYSFEIFFSCLYQCSDSREEQIHQVKFYKFLFDKYEKFIKPSLLWMFIRYQPRMLIDLLKLDKNIIHIFYQRLSTYKYLVFLQLFSSYGEEIARLIFVLEMGGLSKMIEPQDLIAQFHIAYQISKKVCNQLVYFMIKYMCLENEHIYIIYNNLLDPMDYDLKLLLIMIQYFFSENRIKLYDTDLLKMLENLTNQVCSKYQQ